MCLLLIEERKNAEMSYPPQMINDGDVFDVIKEFAYEGN